MKTLKKMFVSLKISLLLLSFLCLLCIIGTIIPQKLEPRLYLAHYPRIGPYLLSAQADDVFHSPVFVGTLAFLAVSLFLCTVTRLHVTRKRFFDRLALVTSLEIRSMAVQLNLGHDQGKGFVAPPMTSSWTSRKLGDESEVWFRSSGRLSLLGSLLIHVGLLFQLGGGAVDATLGFETMIHGMPGEQVPIPSAASFRASFQAARLRGYAGRLQEIDAADSRIDALHRQVNELDQKYQNGLIAPAFKLSFDRLWVDLYPAAATDSSPVVRNWNSAVSIHFGPEKVASAVLRVNHPLSFGGYAFYQTDWKKKFQNIRVRVISLDGENGFPASLVKTMVASVGIPLSPDWSSNTFVIMDFWPDFKVAHDDFISLSDELNNPAARIAAYDKHGKPMGGAWAFSKKMTDLASHVSDLHYRFFIEDAESVFESGVMVTHYPGFVFIVAGSCLFIIGLGLTFFIAYLEEWILKRPDGRVTLSVSGNRPPVLLRKNLLSLLMELKLSHEEHEQVLPLSEKKYHPE